MTDINGFKTKLFLSSFGLGILSGVAFFNPNTAIKNLGMMGLGSSVSAIVMTEILASKLIDENRKTTSEVDKQLKNSQTMVIDLQGTVRKISDELNKIKLANSKLESELEISKDLLTGKTDELTKVRDVAEKNRLALVEVGKFSSDEARKIVHQTYERSVRKLESLLDALIRNYPEVKELLENIYLEVDSFKIRFLGQLEDYDKLMSFDDLIDVGLQLQEQIIDRCTSLKVKSQTIVIRYLSDIVSDSVPYQDYETQIQNLTLKAAETIKQNQESIAQEWVTSNVVMEERYNNEFSEVLSTGKYAIGRMQQMETRLEELQNQLAELQKPLLFNGVSDFAQAGNGISLYFFNRYKYLLDCIQWEENETGYKLLFSIRRNSGLTATELHADNSREQMAVFTNSLKGVLPEFGFNYQNATIELPVILRKKIKKPTEQQDLSKLWKPSTVFKNTVRNWSRIRITGGSESGKSPTAENLAVAILEARPGTVKLFNPQHDSTKNFWSIPVCGVNHTDSENGIGELAETVKQRSEGGSKDEFQLWIYDEIDSTMTQTKSKKAVIGGRVNYIIKQASHQNLGAIFLGQNANVSEYPGMDRSDWNSAVNLHIGNNAYEAIENSNQFTTDAKTKLKNIADTLTEYCQTKNDELGLDHTDPTAYRFAFVVEPGKRPYFIELPNFGQFTFDQLSTPVLAQKPTCPDCGSSNLKSNGRGKKQCKDCGRNFSV